MVNINLNIQKKDLWLLSVIVVFLAGVGFVVAYNSGGPASVMGHSADEMGFNPSDINALGWGDDSNGEVTFPNGLQMKWGKAAPGAFSVDFTTEGLTDFNNACFQVILQTGNTGTHSNEHPDAVTRLSRTGFTIMHSTDHTPFRWFAIGR